MQSDHTHECIFLAIEEEMQAYMYVFTNKKQQQTSTCRNCSGKKGGGGPTFSHHPMYPALFTPHKINFIHNKVTLLELPTELHVHNYVEDTDFKGEIQKKE